MSLWEFAAVSKGWSKANGAGEETAKPPSEDRMFELLGEFAE